MDTTTVGTMGRPRADSDTRMRQLSTNENQHYQNSGYVVVRRFFDQSMADRMIDHYMTMRAAGPMPGDSGGTDDDPDDPNHRFPRMINMHRWDRFTADLAHRPDLTAIVSRWVGVESDDALLQTTRRARTDVASGPAAHHDRFTPRCVDCPGSIRLGG